MDRRTLAIYGLAEMPKYKQITPRPRHVEIVAFSDVQLLDLAGPLQVFASANDWSRRAGRTAPYEIRVVASRTPIASSAGLGLLATGWLCRSGTVDTLVVAGGNGVHKACEDRHFVRWLAARSRRARRIVSICSGAFLIGAAGLLDGRRVVTHWMDCAELARRFPKARVENDPIFIRDGRLWTSAGVTAGIDLSLALVEEDLGHATAIAVARDLVMFLKRPGGQTQFSAVLSLQARDVEFDRLHGWIAGHLACDLSVPALAAEAGMSERSFIRHYRAATGLTPARAVETLRIEAARQLLATTRLPIKRIVQRCGFGSEETMRRGFLRRIAATPQEYRARFAAARSSDADEE